MKKLLLIMTLGFNLINVSYADTFEVEKAKYKTVLIKENKSPQPYTNEKPPSGIESIQYNSNGRLLKAWFALPPKPSTEKLPAVIYLHGGFSFAEQDFLDAKAFLDNGFALLTPTFRGENGNDGNFELFYGEVDDALASLDWLQKNKNVDRNRIFIFGHSTGGALSDLTSLYKKDGVLLSGSSGSLYPPQVFTAWSTIIPFNPEEQKEIILRTFILNLTSMNRKHIAYLGEKDTSPEILNAYKKIIDKAHAPLEIKVVSGDHFSSLHNAIQQFIQEIKKY